MPDGTHSAQTEQRTRGGVDTSTLFVAAAASVIAAVVSSKLWASGTLVSTAMTPVIVSLLKEYLQRPVEKIHAAAKAPIVAVRSGSTTAVPALARRGSAPPEAERRGRLLDEPDGPDSEDYERLDTLMPPGEGVISERPYQVYRKRSDRSSRLAWWRIGLGTGLVAFVIAAAVITLPELVGGSSVAGTGRTTLFSHHTSTSSPTSQKSDTTTSTTGDQPSTSTPSSSPDQSTTTTPQSTTSSPQSQQSTTPSSSTPTTPAAPTPATPQATTPSGGQ